MATTSTLDTDRDPDGRAAVNGLSDDVYVLTAEEAEKHVSPPELRLLNVKPEQAHVKPGGEQSFTVEGVDQYGNNIQPGAIAWTATAGTIGCRWSVHSRRR